jgi:hypothetical protein
MTLQERCDANSALRWYAYSGLSASRFLRVSFGDVSRASPEALTAPHKPSP